MGPIFKPKGGWLPGEDFGDEVYSAAPYLGTEENFEPVYYDPIFIADQKSTLSCVANAAQVALGIQLFNDPEWPVIQRISRLQAYWQSRRLHNGQDKDLGTYIKTLAQGLRKYGVSDEYRWPFDLDKVNTQPSFDAFVHGSLCKGMNYYEIPGNATIIGTKRALARGYLPIFGALVGNSFSEYDGLGIIDKQSGNLYGHCMVCNGWDYMENGEEIFFILNSWGKLWGNLGRGLVSSEFMSRAKDVTILNYKEEKKYEVKDYTKHYTTDSPEYFSELHKTLCGPHSREV